MVDPDFKYYLLVPAFVAVLALILVGGDAYTEKMRYDSFLQAQQNVLDCRKVTNYNMMDKACGKVPVLEEFK